MHDRMLFSSCNKMGTIFRCLDWLKVLVVGRCASIFRVEYEGTYINVFTIEISKISKDWQWSGMLINTPRLSKDKRLMDLVKRGAVCLCL